jgi:hypothetical protein
MNERARPVALVIAAFAAIQLPFLATAFRVDDTNILAIARQIAHAPFDPYGFTFNWTGTPRPAFDILANPPLVPALLAGWAGLFGWSEIALHVLTLLFAAGALAAMAFIAVREEIDPAMAAAMLAVSPAFFLTAHVVMPDMVMLALLLSSVAFALHDRPWMAAACGFFVALAKYNGVVAIPILAFVAWRQRSKPLAFAAASPIAGLATWSLFSLLRYGRIHLLVVGEERRQNIISALGYFSRRGQHVGATDLMVSILTIIGLAVVPLGWHLVVRSSRITWLVSLILGGTLAAFAHDLPISSRLLMVAGIALGLRVLVAAVVGKRWLGLVWIVAVLLFQGATILIAVRYLLPIVAGALLMIPGSRSARLYPAIGISLLLALAVAVGDARHAACYRDTANQLRGRHFYFAGHWGWQYYAAGAGGVQINASLPLLLRPGDMAVFTARTFATPSIPQLAPWARASAIEVPCASRWLLQTTTCEGGGSWYGDEIAGCGRFPIDLPFAFSQEALDRFRFFVVK